MKRSTRLLVLMAALLAVAGLTDASMHISPQKPAPFSLIYGFLLAALIYRWCRVFADERDSKPPFGMSILAAFLPPIGVPIYLFRVLPVSRAVVGTFKAVLFVIALLFVYSVAFWAGELLAA